MLLHSSGMITGNVTGITKAKATSQQTSMKLLLHVHKVPTTNHLSATLIDNTYGLQYQDRSFIGASG